MKYTFFPWIFLALVLAGCQSSQLPKPGSSGYLDEVKAFYVGLAALEVGDDVRADSTLETATKLAPGEPAGWANWGLLALRQGNFDVAAQRLGQAGKLAPQNGQIYYLNGVLESKRGNPAQAIVALRQAVKLEPQNLRAVYLLAQQVERQGDPNSEAEFQQLLQQVLSVQPDNPAALLELARVAAKRGDAQTLHTAVSRLAAHAGNWPQEVQPQWTALETAASAGDPRGAAVRVAFLRNSLMRLPDFRQSLNILEPTAGNEATPFSRFLILPTPVFTPPAADTSLKFPARMVGSETASWVGAIPLGSEGAPVVTMADDSAVKLATGAQLPFPGAKAILPVDFNYDFKVDLVLAGERGVRFFRQESPTAFTDVTAATKLPAGFVQGAYRGAWAIDIEADGDMDILLATDGAPVVLRNNGDGSFTPIHPFAGVTGVGGLAWVDLDEDGNPDAAILDHWNGTSGTLHLFHNQRGGVFQEVALPAGLGAVKAVTVADVKSDGRLALVALEESGSLVASMREGPVVQLGSVPATAGPARLLAGDFDNNGVTDLLVASSDAARLWLGNGGGKFSLLPAPVTSARVFDVADLNADGRLDLLGLSPDGHVQTGINQGSKQYSWQILRPRAHVATGDQRINSFGIGGEMELRAGLLVQKQPITSPLLHFGLGEQTNADVVRIQWPNGMEIAEFALLADQEVLSEQRL